MVTLYGQQRVTAVAIYVGGVVDEGTLGCGHLCGCHLLARGVGKSCRQKQRGRLEMVTLIELACSRSALSSLAGARLVAR